MEKKKSNKSFEVLKTFIADILIGMFYFMFLFGIAFLLPEFVHFLDKIFPGHKYIVDIAIFIEYIMLLADSIIMIVFIYLQSKYALTEMISIFNEKEGV